MTPPERRGIDATIPLFGLGGMPQYLVAVPRSSVDPQHRVNRARPEGSPGEYRLVFLLQRPGYSLYGEYQFAFEAPGVKGDSYLAIKGPALTGTMADEIQIEATTDGGTFTYRALPNDEGFIGRIETVVQANGFFDAEQRAYRALAPTLSHWATYFDTPVMIARVESTELQFGTTQMRATSPYDAHIFRVEAGEPLGVELRAFESYYREGINSNSPTYQLLCFFKIIEGIRAHRIRARRARVRAAAPEAPLPDPPIRFEERVPDDRALFHDWLNAMFPQTRMRTWDDAALEAIFIREAVGRSVDELVFSPRRGGRMGPLLQLRNDVAHSLWESGAPTLIVDEALHVDRVTRWLPITKCLTRLMLLNDFGAQLGFPGVAGDDHTARDEGPAE